MGYFLVYVTTSSENEAKNIAQVVVSGRQAACANILGKSTSIYNWEGEIHTETETVLILKTTTEKLDALISRLKQIHSYQCPCIVALGIQHGNTEFLDWIAKEVS